DHAALGPGPRDGAQVDAALARDAPRQRRSLDPAVARGRGLDLRHPFLAVGRRLPPALAILFTRARRRALLLRIVAHLDRFALLADDGDCLADFHLTFRDGDLEEDTGGVGLDLLRHLVGVELVERLALLDLVALGLEPLDDRPGLHPLAETRQLDLSRHASLTPYGPADRLQNVVGVRHDPLLHHGCERQRREPGPDALDRRVEPVEGAVLDHRRDLRSEPHAGDRLVCDDAAV